MRRTVVDVVNCWANHTRRQLDGDEFSAALSILQYATFINPDLMPITYKAFFAHDEQTIVEIATEDRTFAFRRMQVLFETNPNGKLFVQASTGVTFHVLKGEPPVTLFNRISHWLDSYYALTKPWMSQ